MSQGPSDTTSPKGMDVLGMEGECVLSRDTAPWLQFTFFFPVQKSPGILRVLDPNYLGFGSGYVLVESGFRLNTYLDPDSISSKKL